MTMHAPTITAGPYGPWPGDNDLTVAAAALAARLPDELAPLARLAYSYRWTWLRGGDNVFRSVDPHRFELCGGNAVRLLQEAPTRSLIRAANDTALLERAAALEAEVHAELRRPWHDGPVTPERPAVFLCAEYALHGSLPIYSGGLGVLAGDILKQASDQRIPLVAVGLLYRQGYFRQRLDPSGWQHEYWVDTDPERLPATLVGDGPRGPLTVTVEIRGRAVTAQIWRVDVGRVALYLLDVERPENARIDRWITGRLYVGDAETRLAQYLLLGIGGLRAIRALGIEPGLVHLNEGHAAFAPLELARAAIECGADPPGALADARRRTVFTTHTPVAAGNDTYDRAMVRAALGSFPAALGMAPDDVCTLGDTGPGEGRVGVTQLGLRLSRSANGVSRRHGEVARTMWRGLYPDHAVEDVPIGHVNNGVHIGTWMAAPMRALLDRHLGPGWEERAADPWTWATVDAIPDEELWAARAEQRAHLVDVVRERSVADRLERGESPDYVDAAARVFDHDVVTIGFARRLARYKRLDLLAHDMHRALDLLADPRPIQILIAGKAHPRDDDAKRIVQGLFVFKPAAHVGERVVYLHDYDLSIAPTLVAGCDVWVNLPRPPLEASGTSGMKSALNGGLQLSVLDGWWPEAYDGANGWAIAGDVDADPAAQDARHADAFYSLLETEIVPDFSTATPVVCRRGGWPACGHRFGPSPPASPPPECSMTTSPAPTAGEGPRFSRRRTARKRSRHEASSSPTDRIASSFSNGWTPRSPMTPRLRLRPWRDSRHGRAALARVFRP
jgi:starch phosphorylase